MTALDTSVIVRFLTRDDNDQFEKAYALISAEACFVPLTVMLETAWVLEFVYNYSTRDVAWGLRRILGLPRVEVSRPHVLDRVLRWYEDGLDVADAVVLAVSQHANQLATFDRAFVAEAEEKGQCPVVDLGTSSGGS